VNLDSPMPDAQRWRTTMPDYILIGSRAGVLWRCYREPDETEAHWQARADAMREAFNRGDN
jgi:hypothetical protein